MRFELQHVNSEAMAMPLSSHVVVTGKLLFQRKAGKPLCRDERLPRWRENFDGSPGPNPIVF